MEIFSLSAIEHVLKHRPRRVKHLWVSSPQEKSPRVQHILATAKQHQVTVDTFSTKKDEEPVKALIHPFEYQPLSALLESIKKKSLVLALDHLQDPQNFGAMARTADALGVDAILVPKDRAATIGPGVYAASVGAIETVSIVQVTNLGEGLRKLKEKNYWIVGSRLGGGAKPIADLPSFDRVVLVMGRELEGLSPSIEGLCDWLVEIPLRGKVQSLNVSAAGAILMYECVKRHLLI